MKSFWLTIATFFRIGNLPLAPGTYTSFITAAVVFAIAKWLGPLSHLWLPAATLPIFIIGVVSAHKAEKILGGKDPRAVVIDEVAGQMVALWWAPLSIYAYGAAFVLFRIFDILKPFPVSWADRRIRGGWGIMLDDILAGLYALGILHLLLLIYSRLA